jgi:aminobenzoyl-glutamate utilization protein B
MAAIRFQIVSPLFVAACWIAYASAASSEALALPAAKQAALDAAASLDGEMNAIATALWEYAETGLEEHRSAALLADTLEGEGFRVERGVAGMPTAFVAEWGRGHPIVGVLAEYDALPGLGNAPVSSKEPRIDGHPHGHGCGHNVFGAGSVGAAIALKRAAESQGLKGTIRLYGTPAEETLVGKVYMARDGLFDDLDVALDWHPVFLTRVNNESSMAMNNFAVEFYGRAAHGARPWHGRSALDAVELMNHGVNLMREHIEPTARIHYVVSDGGQAPNVVPDYARVWYYVRDSNREKVERNYAWMLEIAAGAAQATQTRHEVSLLTGVHSVLLNRPLQEAAQANLELVGPPRYTDEEQEFARSLQRELGIEALGISTRVEPLADEPGPPGDGSTDVAEVSRITPTLRMVVALGGEELPWHSWASSASAGTPGAAKAAHVAARVLALTGVDVLTDPGLVERARAEFVEKTGGRRYRSPLPKGQAPPLPDSGR